MATNIAVKIDFKGSVKDIIVVSDDTKEVIEAIKKLEEAFFKPETDEPAEKK